METKILKVATVNNVAIVITDDENQLVPIKPICDALGIDFEGQRQRINRDEILSSIAFMTKAVAADGKDREMVNLPLKYVFGWLFTIDTSRVSEEARPVVIKYKMECYDVLYRYFTEPLIFIKQQQVAANALMDKYQKARIDFRDAKAIMDDYYNRFNRVRKLTIEEWRINNSVLEIDFETAETKAEN